MAEKFISDTNPIRIMAYALHDVFGYNERWSTDEGAKALIDELERKGLAIGVTGDDLRAMYRDGYAAGREDMAIEYGADPEDE